MENYQKEISRIKNILKENPKGMTVTDISRKMKTNRNSVAKYLDIMRISGLVEMITFGPAKVFFPSKRVPVSKMLNYTSDYIMVLDRNLKINMVNNSFLDFLNAEDDDLIGQKIDESFPEIFTDVTDVLNNINEALDGRENNEELTLEKKGENYYFNMKIVPTTFEDGKHGATLIMDDITDHKIVEEILLESEQNFRELIEKIKK